MLSRWMMAAMSLDLGDVTSHFVHYQPANLFWNDASINGVRLRAHGKVADMPLI
jgi:hypothetical protein